MKLTRSELNEYIKLKDEVRSASAQMHITKNEKTECAFDEAIEALGVFEDAHGIEIGTPIEKLTPKTNFQCITASPQALAEFIWIITDICLNYDKYSDSEIKHYEKCLQGRNDIVEWLEKENTDNLLPLPQEE